jgi:hypothetical protein
MEDRISPWQHATRLAKGDENTPGGEWRVRRRCRLASARIAAMARTIRSTPSNRADKNIRLVNSYVACPPQMGTGLWIFRPEVTEATWNVNVC